MKPCLHFEICVKMIRTRENMSPLPHLEEPLAQGLADPGQLL
jgi:hypothetical protein